MNSLFWLLVDCQPRAERWSVLAPILLENPPKGLKCAGTAYRDQLSLRELRSRASLRFRLSAETRYSRYRKGALSAARG